MPRHVVRTGSATLSVTLVALVATLAVALVTVLGGWAPATPAGPTTRSAGTEIEAAPFRVRLDRAEAAYRVGDRDADEGRAFLVVDARVEVAHDETATSTTLSRLVTADLDHAYDVYGGETADPAPEVRVAADDTSLLGIGPGLAYDVRLVFVVDETDVPSRLALVVSEHARRRSAIDRTPGWFDPAPVARVVLDVAPLPATRPEPEGL